MAKAEAPAPTTLPDSAKPDGPDAKAAGVTISPGGMGDVLLQAGLLPGDKVTAINAQPVNSIETVTNQLLKGGSVTLQVERAGRTISLTSGTPKK